MKISAFRGRINAERLPKTLGDGQWPYIGRGGLQIGGELLKISRQKPVKQTKKKSPRSRPFSGTNDEQSRNKKARDWKPSQPVKIIGKKQKRKKMTSSASVASGTPDEKIQHGPSTTASAAAAPPSWEGRQLRWPQLRLNSSPSCPPSPPRIGSGRFIAPLVNSLPEDVATTSGTTGVSAAAATVTTSSGTVPRVATAAAALSQHAE